MSNDGKINILLVDDRSENLLALEAIIERDDYNLIKAFSGEEALKYLLKYDFAAILLDVQMPGIDGFGTAKIIKAREKTKNIPILFITANNMESQHIFTGYSIGAIDYILKPFDPIILKAKVEGFVEIYKMNQKLIQQTDILSEKTNELEKAYKELSKITSNLRESEALASVISETSIDSMIVIDKDGLILKVNPAVTDMLFYDEVDIKDQNISALFTCEESERYINNVLKRISSLNYVENLAGGENLKEVTITRKDGTMFSAEMQIGRRYVQDKCIVACTIRDITKKKHYQEMITHMAYHDGLTDLPNRRFFNDQLTRELNVAKDQNQSLAMMYLDMDRFKYINDSLGHLVGDRVLQEIAKRLQTAVREGDLLARVGGDEFNIILPETNREDALEIAENILDVFKKPISVDHYELFITTCIGISIFPYDGEDSTVLMKNADAALYRAKEQGKNTYRVFHSGMNIQSYRTFIMQNDLRKAIERNEFSLVYQPRIDIKSSGITSAEALIRWDHPNWGRIQPLEFIPLAEETGLIVEVGDWVLREVCRQINAWQEIGLDPIRIAVNFSAQQFLQKNIVHNILTILRETDINPNLIEIEITESVILGNESTIINSLHELRKLGVSISIDDFGTGYCSLNYLRRFPVNTLKIDKSFIQDLSNSSNNTEALVSTIISLAHSLDMTVIAEGVEKEEQMNLLQKLHCQEIQGYLFSPPVNPENFENFLLKSQHQNTVNQNNNVAYIGRHVVEQNELAATNFVNLTEVDQNQEILNIALTRTKEMYSISSREMDVFKLIVNGLSNKEISNELFISEHTVKNHITHIFQKLTVNDRLQAMAKVYQACIEAGNKLRAQ
jgi:diguanylate cyclase (GGDEF)-like protein/PAS domain S-box-containing protein